MKIGLSLAALLWFLLFATAGCAQEPRDLRVLMIGNSLTAANDLPEMVPLLAGSTGRVRVHLEVFTAPGYSLEDHWQEGKAVPLIRSGHWDLVILQQGPSALPESRVNFLKWGPRFAAEIRHAGGQPALFMVWPSAARRADFIRVSETYRLVALQVGGILIPAGDAWRGAWRRSPRLALYGPDGFHPSDLGSYLAALVIAGTLCHCSVNEMPTDLVLSRRSIHLDPQDAAILKAAADELIPRAP